jgi:hypothetical protein
MWHPTCLNSSVTGVGTHLVFLCHLQTLSLYMPSIAVITTLILITHVAVDLVNCMQKNMQIFRSTAAQVTKISAVLVEILGLEKTRAMKMA